MLRDDVESFALRGRWNRWQCAEKNTTYEHTILFDNDEAEWGRLIEIFNNALGRVALHNVPLAVVALQQGTKLPKIIAGGATNHKLHRAKPSPHHASVARPRRWR